MSNRNEKVEKMLALIKERIASRTPEQLMKELHECSGGGGPTIIEFMDSLSISSNYNLHKAFGIEYNVSMTKIGSIHDADHSLESLKTFVPVLIKNFPELEKFKKLIYLKEIKSVTYACLEKTNKSRIYLSEKIVFVIDNKDKGSFISVNEQGIETIITPENGDVLIIDSSQHQGIISNNKTKHGIVFAEFIIYKQGI